MKLKELFDGVKILYCNVDTEMEVSLPTFDGRKAGSKDVFFCFKGKKHCGEDFLAKVILAGVSVVVTENQLDEIIPQIRVLDTRLAFAVVAGNYFGNPAKEMSIVTVVGTNGKTTTAYMLTEILKFCGTSVGMIGTVYNEINNVKTDAEMTTPDPFELQKLFFDMKNAGVKVVVMELSAHAIHYKKLGNVFADCAIFTNISQDHLDFFGDMKTYANTKLNYFLGGNIGTAIINVDDNCGAMLANKIDTDVVTYALKNPSDIFAIDRVVSVNKTSFVANIFDDILSIEDNFFGEFNIYNVLAASTAAVILGVRTEEIVVALKHIHPIEGRFNTIELKGARFVVDFAHTPDGLENLLRETKKICKQKLIIVFGCGGERDSLKREIMGKIAQEYADFIVLTADNSRSENTTDIIEMIKKGITAQEKTVSFCDRGQAIKFAYNIAKDGDFVVIAGKGAEKYIELSGEKIPFNDLDFVKNLG